MARKSKALLPKRIGKIKVGKSVRKGALADVLASKAGQALIAQAVLAIGAVATAKLKENRRTQHAVPGGKAKGAEMGHDASAATATLTYALGEAVRSFSEALHRAPADRAQGGDDGGWAPLAPSRGTKAAKPRTPHPEPSVSPPS
jgi:hypothetical protein